MLPSYVWLSVAAVSLSLPLLALSLLMRPSQVAQRSLANLQRGWSDAPTVTGPTAASDGSGKLRLWARRLTPNRSIRRLDGLLARAGRPAAWPVDRVLLVKLVLPLAFAALSLAVLGSSPTRLLTALAIGVTATAYFVPDLLLQSRGQERSQKIALELADTLDQMTIAVEAGLGFDSAMARAAKNGKGVLAEELARTLQDMQVGQSRRQAYEALATRTGVTDLRRFVRAVIQADQYGIAIADVLRSQADEMRIKRRQRAEEKAMQIPIKVIFPLMLCILPVLFIVLLGPAVMDIVAAFS